ncbi:hypothetical protein PUNSTDRAFT_48322 [Punctularia strigosozonata HHB-11173 SS5]|uniref:uncharacterized protein n=1 Tax=Punctularia strigosozonata (strain HHB-11173) TaxID=741275 RepID=UPI0004416E93|nr:uncharacterized protein PUNSTDRAFT_48322 [Punctularia strigosozonata HHB-11173 SS5]EIN13291.1 hypothetical protein PUNSTDRAFT_48322 [Punctularia strigosozonata HHB-11173 SS5]
MNNPRSISASVLLAFILLIPGVGASVRRDLSDVNWISPTSGSAFDSGSSLSVKWSSKQEVDTPSFRLCVPDDGSSARRRSIMPSHVVLRPSHGYSRSSRRALRNRASRSQSIVLTRNSHDGNEDGDGLANGSDGDSEDDAVHEDATPEDSDGEQADGVKAVDSDAAGDVDTAGQENTSCGDPLTPEVQDVDGTYVAILAAPNVAAEATFYLQMEDSSGQQSISPTFSLSSISATSDNSTAGTSAAASPTGNNDTTQAALDKARRPPPVAAYAVPLSMVGAVLLVALCLAWRQHRKLRQDRLESLANMEKSSLRTTLSHPLAYGSTTRSLKNEKGGSEAFVPTLYSEPSYGPNERYTAIPRRSSRWDYAPGSMGAEPRPVTHEPCWPALNQDFEYRSTDSMRMSRNFGTAPVRAFRQAGAAGPASPHIDRRATDSAVPFGGAQERVRVLTPARMPSEPLMHHEGGARYSKPLPPAPLRPRYTPSINRHYASQPSQASPHYMPERQDMCREAYQAPIGGVDARSRECDEMYDAVHRALSSGHAHYR